MFSIPSSTIAARAGIGLRTAHLPEILNQGTPIPWLELLADNWLASGGPNRHFLDEISSRYPVTLHGVGLSLGGMDPLDFSYLKQIRELKQRSGALWYSEHLCFSRMATVHSHDLLPLPYTDEAIRHVIRRIGEVQDFLGERILIENVSSYLEYTQSELDEGAFIAMIANEADCGLILDVNNLYVNQVNHGQDALVQMAQIPPERVCEIHLAGYADQGTHLIDAHNNPVSEPVWQLYQQALARFGPVATLIEWDNDLPDLAVLYAEQNKAQSLLDEVGNNDVGNNSLGHNSNGDKNNKNAIIEKKVTKTQSVNPARLATERVRCP